MVISCVILWHVLAITHAIEVSKINDKPLLQMQPSLDTARGANYFFLMMERLKGKARVQGKQSELQAAKEFRVVESEVHRPLKEAHDSNRHLMRKESAKQKILLQDRQSLPRPRDQMLTTAESELHNPSGQSRDARRPLMRKESLMQQVRDKEKSSEATRAENEARPMLSMRQTALHLARRFLQKKSLDDIHMEADSAAFLRWICLLVLCIGIVGGAIVALAFCLPQCVHSRRADPGMPAEEAQHRSYSELLGSYRPSNFVTVSKEGEELEADEG
jgi:hypothetical protein